MATPLQLDHLCHVPYTLPPPKQPQALVVLVGVAPEQLSPYSPHLCTQLLQEGAEGRLWEGKEGLLTALGALAAGCTRTLCVTPGGGGGGLGWGGLWEGKEGLLTAMTTLAAGCTRTLFVTPGVLWMGGYTGVLEGGG